MTRSARHSRPETSTSRPPGKAASIVEPVTISAPAPAGPRQQRRGDQARGSSAGDLGVALLPHATSPAVPVIVENYRRARRGRPNGSETAQPPTKSRQDPEHGSHLVPLKKLLRAAAVS